MVTPFSFAIALTGLLCVAVAATETSKTPSDEMLNDILLHQDMVVGTFLDSEDDEFQRSLVEGSTEGKSDRTFMQRCGNRNACASGLACEDFSLGSRCTTSADCVRDKLLAFNEMYDMESIKADVLEDAGVTTEDLVLALGPDNIFQGPVQRARAFVASQPFRALMKSIHKFFSEPGVELLKMQGECMGKGEEDSSGQLPFNYGYIGGVVEFGAIADFAIMGGSNPLDDSDGGFGRVCFGAGVGAGVEFGIMAGGVSGAGDFEDGSVAQCVSLQVDTDLAAVWAIGAQAGFLFNGRGYAEFYPAGWGLGAELLGASFCVGFAGTVF